MVVLQLYFTWSTFSLLLSLEPLFSQPSSYYSPLVRCSCNPPFLITQSSLLFSTSAFEHWVSDKTQSYSRHPNFPTLKSPSSYSPDKMWLIIPLTDPVSLDCWGILIIQPQPSSRETPNLQAIFQTSQTKCFCAPHAWNSCHPMWVWLSWNLPVGEKSE